MQVHRKDTSKIENTAQNVENTDSPVINAQKLVTTSLPIFCFRYGTYSLIVSMFSFKCLDTSRRSHDCKSVEDTCPVCLDAGLRNKAIWHIRYPPKYVSYYNPVSKKEFPLRKKSEQTGDDLSCCLLTALSLINQSPLGQFLCVFLDAFPGRIGFHMPHNKFPASTVTCVSLNVFPGRIDFLTYCK